MDTQGFTLQAGDQVQVKGFWEDDELKATQVTRLADGQSITLRDEVGRPAWSGSGKRAAERQVATGETLQGQGRSGGGGQGAAGQGGRGQAAGGYGGGQGRVEAPGSGSPLAEAHVEDWLSVEGAVGPVDGSALVVQTTDGQEVVVEGRAWRFAQELGFSVQEGDEVNLLGFYEDGEFKASQIEDTTNGQTVLVRDESGRPMWAGGGRQDG
jgi:hypothetical protein